MADIFISYARGNRAAVSRLAEALEQAGWSVWWDQRIEGGAAFARHQSKMLAASLDGTSPPFGFRQYQHIGFGNWSGDPASR